MRARKPKGRDRAGRRGWTGWRGVGWLAGCALLGWLLWSTACAVLPARTEAGQPPAGRQLPAGLSYRVEIREQPRPLRIHILVVELDQRALELAVAAGPDPDGPGGAESQLVEPTMLAAEAGMVAAVNANAFAWFGGEEATSRSARWRAGMPVDILGWAHDGRRQASPPEPGYWSVWQETGGRVRLGQVRQAAPVRWAAAGFGALVMAGQEVPLEDRARHPRTAVGVDRTGRRLFWVVVDGRQPGYSEGMTLRELAAWMRGLGCWEAINLDGGGSSAMLVRDPRGGWAVLNRPSEGRLRPVPVLLGIRLRGTASGARSSASAR